MDEVKALALNENLFAAPTAFRANQIFNTVSGRVKALDSSFMPLFLNSDLATQKLITLYVSLHFLFGKFLAFVNRIVFTKAQSVSKEHAIRCVVSIGF